MLAIFSVINAQKFNYIYNGQEFKCRIKDGLVMITGFDTKAHSVTIPSKVKYQGVEYKVNSINTFLNGVNYLTVKLAIEEGVEEINNFAFNEFRKLRELRLPASIKYIGKNAIRDNNRLVYHIPSSIDIESLKDGREIWPSGGEIVTIESQFQRRAVEEQEVLIAKDTKKQQSNMEKELEQQRKELEKLKKEKEELLAANQELEEENDDTKKSKGGIFGGIKNKVGSIKNLTGKLLIGNAFAKNSDKEEEEEEDVYEEAKKQPKNNTYNNNKKEIVSSKSNKIKAVDVDMDIPVTNSTKNQNTYCVIIANENYEDVPVVDYASRDGEIFKEYCIKTLGIPEKQIRSFIDASYTDIKRALNWLESITSIAGEDSKIIFYYAGHGIPNDKDKSAYLIPTDGFPKDITTCFKLSDLYTRLSKLKTKNVTVFLDACFSGVKRGSEQTLVAARGVAIKPKEEVLKGNMIVFTATSDDETALAYQEKRHGMFTYYLLDQLKKTKGKTTLGNLYKTVSQEVKKSSMLENDKIQTPSVNVSNNLKNNWMNMQF